MACPFVISEHTFDGQHIREYPRALADSQEDTIRLHAKSYTPHEARDDHTAGDLTVVAFHANAFQKEVYEPFFETLYRRLKEEHGLTIGSIWIADQAAQGRSALLNDNILGNDPSWFDHSRDVLNMVNTFRNQMRRPIVAIGHSMGGAQAVATAHMHPRLFEAIILIDPSIATGPAPTLKPMLQSALHKPDRFESMEAAVRNVRKHPAFRDWDSRAMQRYIDTGFHTSSTVLSDDDSIKPVTTSHIEYASTVRPNIDRVGVGPLSDIQHALYPNIDPKGPLVSPVYNPHSRIAWSLLPSLRPPTFFLLGEGSRICRAEQVERRTKLTGTEPGGSGGVASDKVSSRTIPGGHFLPMTNIEGTADAAAAWLGAQIQRHRETEVQLSASWNKRAKGDKQRLDAKTVPVLRKWDGTPWSLEESPKSRL